MYEIQFDYKLKIKVDLPDIATIEDLYKKQKEITKYISGMTSLGAEVKDLEFLDWRIYTD